MTDRPNFDNLILYGDGQVERHVAHIANALEKNAWLRQPLQGSKIILRVSYGDEPIGEWHLTAVGVVGDADQFVDIDKTADMPLITAFGPDTIFNLVLPRPLDEHLPMRSKMVDPNTVVVSQRRNPPPAPPRQVPNPSRSEEGFFPRRKVRDNPQA